MGVSTFLLAATELLLSDIAPTMEDASQDTGFDEDEFQLALEMAQRLRRPTSPNGHEASLTAYEEDAPMPVAEVITHEAENPEEGVAMASFADLQAASPTPSVPELQRAFAPTEAERLLRQNLEQAPERDGRSGKRGRPSFFARRRRVEAIPGSRQAP